MKENISSILFVIGFVLMIDFIFWLFWAMSGQQPTDSFYLGTISQHILQLIF